MSFCVLENETKTASCCDYKNKTQFNRKNMSLLLKLLCVDDDDDDGDRHRFAHWLTFHYTRTYSH